jgi:hypothetical protein
MATQTDALRPTNEGLTVEERAGAAARAKFADWHKAELEERPRRVLFFAFVIAVILTVAIVLVIHGRP